MSASQFVTVFDAYACGVCFLSVWKGEIVCWGGLPSTIFDPSYSMSLYRRYVDDLRETAHVQVIEEEQNVVVVGEVVCHQCDLNA